MAGQYPTDLIDRVRDLNDIVSVISEHVTLKRAGGRFVGLCPFHAEKTPSFSVSQEKQLFYCFGCRAAGNVFSFVMRLDNLTFPEAVKRLGERVGLDVSRYVETDQDRRARERREQVFEANRLAQAYYRQVLLRSDLSRDARDYLVKRGIGPEWQEKFGIGFAPKAWDALIRALGKRGYSEDALVDAGLALKSDHGYRDRFRERIMFPIYDIYGRVIGFGGRALNQDTGPKYLNSPETPVFAKRSALYGINLATESIRAKGHAVLVEGYTDVIAFHRAGIGNVVASLGTALSSDQGRLVLRYAKKVILCYDADSAGSAATARGVDILGALGIEITVAPLPKGQDPDGVVNASGGAALAAIIERSVPFARFRLESVLASMDLNNRDNRIRAAKAIVPIIGQVQDEIEKSEYVREMSNRLSVDPDALWAEVKKVRKQGSSGVNKMTEGMSRGRTLEAHRSPAYAKLERSLLRQAMASRENLMAVKEAVGEKGFEIPTHAAIFRVMLIRAEEDGGLEAKAIIDRMEETARDEAMSVLVPPEPEGDGETLGTALEAWRRFRVKRRLTEIDDEIRNAEKSGDIRLVQQLMLEQSKLRADLGPNVAIYR